MAENNEPIQTKDAGQQWEYKQTSGAIEESLNKLGNENWELVAIGPTGYCTFKRPKQKKGSHRLWLWSIKTRHFKNLKCLIYFKLIY